MNKIDLALQLPFERCFVRFIMTCASGNAHSAMAALRNISSHVDFLPVVCPADKSGEIDISGHVPCLYYRHIFRAQVEYAIVRNFNRTLKGRRVRPETISCTEYRWQEISRPHVPERASRWIRSVAMDTDQRFVRIASEVSQQLAASS